MPLPGSIRVPSRSKRIAANRLTDTFSSSCQGFSGSRVISFSTAQPETGHRAWSGSSSNRPAPQPVQPTKWLARNPMTQQLAGMNPGAVAIFKRHIAVDHDPAIAFGPLDSPPIVRRNVVDNLPRLDVKFGQII